MPNTVSFFYHNILLAFDNIMIIHQTYVFKFLSDTRHFVERFFPHALYQFLVFFRAG